MRALQTLLSWNVKNYPFCFSSLLEHKEHKEDLINMLSVSPKFNSNAKYAIKGLNIRQKSNLGWLSYLYKYVNLALMGPREKWHWMQLKGLYLLLRENNKVIQNFL